LNLADKAGEPCFSGQDVETAQGIAQEISGLVNFSALHSRLESAYQELAQAQQAKEDLMHLIFHDMKAPITAVKEVLGMLEPPGGLQAGERSQYLAMARGDLELLWRRITNLLDIKRMDAGRYPLNLMPLNLADMVSEAVQRLAPLSRFDGVELSFAAHAEPMVTGDEDLLERVLSNLILNAAKHAGLNPGKGRVSLSVGVEQDRARVEVFDNGPGVDPALGETIFERYVGGAPQKGSTGLGLFFCRRAAEMMGGRVGYRNQEHGAVFYLDMPLDKEV
jgi:signal transduction histidine kinase